MKSYRNTSLQEKNLKKAMIILQGLTPIYYGDKTLPAKM